MEKSTEQIIRESLSKAISYEEYRALVTQWASQGETSGPEQKESLINYTQLNDKRMRRWDKTFKLLEEERRSLEGFSGKIIWLVLTESWCGDAAPTIPVMHEISQRFTNISLRIVFRDEHPELMDRFLTNKAKSIPKLIMLDSDTLEVLGEWGPRPSIATKMAAAYKVTHGVLSPEFKQDLQVWYNKDKGRNTVKDLLSLLALE